MSTISPDGQFVLSGSETGQPLVWEISSQHPLENENYQCQFMDLVTDCDWNPKYNMFAVSGFG
jgi:WD40 repeat protein